MSELVIDTVDNRNIALPIGMVFLYAGPITDKNKEDLARLGWYLCDGSQVSRELPLFRVIGDIYGRGDGVKTFNLPDYRGRFLRGVDNPTGTASAGRDPDSAQRTESGIGGFSGNRVGSIQPDATSLPTSRFSTSSTGGHNHRVNCETNAGRGHSGDYAENTMARFHVQGPAVMTDQEPNHFHTVTDGGDAETRPLNIYINYIIFGGMSA
ncbi:tail fiber protein [bacterium]|nr:MAG: tail fiber protein [bacterium]